MMDLELVQKLREYLVSSLTLRELDLWLLTRLQDYFDSGDETARMAGQINSLIAEVKEGLAEEAELRSRAFSFVRPMGDIFQTDLSGASSQTIFEMEMDFASQQTLRPALDFASAAGGR